MKAGKASGVRVLGFNPKGTVTATNNDDDEVAKERATQDFLRTIGVAPSGGNLKETQEDWLSLPDVVVMQIFFFLSPRDVIWGAELTCRDWKRVASSEFLWEALHRRIFGGKKPAKKGATKVREGDELGWRDHCLRTARYLTYMQRQGSTDDILRWCCACGHLSLFSVMLSNGDFTQEMLNGEATKGGASPPPNRTSDAPPPSSSKRTGMSPIHLSSMCGDERMTELLARRGVNVNRRDSKGTTPLAIAAKMGHLAVVEVLLRYGATGDDFTKLLDHQTKGTKRGKGKGSEALPLLHSAVAGGHTQIVSKLLARAAERGNLAVLSSVDKNFRTPLHWAAEGGHAPLIELLLNKGAPIQTRAKSDYCTPLHLAVGKNRLEAARYLLQRKASVNPPLDEKIAEAAAGTEGEKSPLQIACERGLFEMVRLLLDFKADINMRAKGKGRSILHFAVTGGEGSVALVQDLVGKVDIEALDKKGSMPIHRLCSHPSPHAKQILEILLDNNVKVDVKGRDEKTPLEMLLLKWIKTKKMNCTRKGDKETMHKNYVKELADILLHRGATPNQKLMEESGLWVVEDQDL